MASYDRRITLYINGQQVQNDVRSIRAEMTRLINEQSRMTIGSDEYVRHARGIQQLRGVLATHNQQIGQTRESWLNFKTLLAGFSIAGTIAALKAGFSSIVESTKTLGDKWEFTMSGMQNGIGYFWKTLASGDWSNFFKNFEQAISVGYRYAEMMDKVKESNWALTIAESDSRAKALKLEDDLKNKLLSKKDRLAAGEERIKLEEELSVKRTKIAQTEYDAALLMAKDRSKLDEKTLVTLLSDIDSETKAQAEQYNQSLDLKKKYENDIKHYVVSNNQTLMSFADKNLKAINDDLSKTPETVKVYAAALIQQGNMTDDMIENLVKAYTKKNDAENSAMENTKKIRVQVHTLMAGIDKENSDLNKDDGDKSNDALEIAHKNQILLLTQRYASEEQLQKEFHARMLAEEIAYIQMKIGIQSDSEKKMDLQTQLISKQNEYVTALKAATPEIMKNSAERQNLAATMFEEAKLTAIAASEMSKAGIMSEELSSKISIQAAVYQQTIGIVSDGLFNMMTGTEDAFQSFAKNLLIFALEQLKVQAQLAYASVFVQAMASPESVITWGAAGMVKAAIIYGLIEAAFAVASGAVASAFSGGSNKTKGYASGGFTDGDAVYRAGEGGVEYVSPNWQLKDARTRPLIGMLEIFRQAGPGRTVSINPGLLAMSETNQLSSGSSTTIQSSGSGNEQTNLFLTLTEELKIQRLTMIKELNEIRSTPMTATVKMFGGHGSIEWSLDQIAAFNKLTK